MPWEYCVVVAVDDGDLGVRHIGAHVGGRAGALVGVGEAHLEHVVLARDDVGGGGAGGQGEDAVVVDLGGYADGGAGGDGARPVIAYRRP